MEQSTNQLVEEFNRKTNLIDSDCEEEVVELEAEDDGDDNSDGEFSFMWGGPDGSPVSADEVFQDGQIKPIFPLFDQSLLFTGDSEGELSHGSPVKVFVEVKDSEAGETAGPCCEWSGKAVEASHPATCKKSNSTGFSKIWRFRDLMHRSSSDGKDAFVFLNPKSEKSGGEVQPKAAGEKVTKAKKVAAGKAKTASSAHEMHYVRNRAVKEGDRRRSYLPYRPELVGFFTNVHGGVRRNMHPF